MKRIVTIHTVRGVLACLKSCQAPVQQRSDKLRIKLQSCAIILVRGLEVTTLKCCISQTFTSVVHTTEDPSAMH